jgi:predicted GIY-YIG superfamily endonuclease
LACEISKKHMYIVYILRSVKKPEKLYIGYTENLSKRLKEHNDKKSNYSSRYAPWKLETCITYSDKNRAKQFEKYLKSGSGFAFLKRRLI